MPSMPMSVWVMLVNAWLIAVALPPLSAAQIMLELDRHLGATFFDTQRGGSAVLWHYLFWIFGHPEAYILVFPSFAIVSEVIPVYSRRPLSVSPPWWARWSRSGPPAWAFERIMCLRSG